MEYIVLDVSDIEIEVIPLHELPGLKTLRVLSMDPDMQRLKMSADLLRLALRNPEDWNGLVKFLSLKELMAVIDQWMEKSQEESNRQTEEDEYFNELRREERALEKDLYEERIAEEESLYEYDEEYEEYKLEEYKREEETRRYEDFVKYLESKEIDTEEPDEDE
jgi:hypothetical protein